MEELDATFDLDEMMGGWSDCQPGCFSEVLAERPDPKASARELFRLILPILRAELILEVS